jgi:hypothetical protein
VGYTPKFLNLVLLLYSVCICARKVWEGNEEQDFFFKWGERSELIFLPLTFFCRNSCFDLVYFVWKVLEG